MSGSCAATSRKTGGGQTGSRSDGPSHEGALPVDEIDGESRAEVHRHYGRSKQGPCRIGANEPIRPRMLGRIGQVFDGDGKIPSENDQGRT